MNRWIEVKDALLALIALVTLTAMLLIAPAAWGHEPDGDFQGGFMSGFTHPFYGLDHVAAMVAVGIWGAFLGRPAIWVLPVVFPVIMAVGGVAAIVGVAVPLIEPGIALSSIALGLAILAKWRAPSAVAGVLVGVFAIFHGHAHGAELPHATEPAAYAVGFVISTGLLHAAGIAFGLLAGRPRGAIALRAVGAVIAAAGLGFLVGVL